VKQTTKAKQPITTFHGLCRGADAFPAGSVARILLDNRNALGQKRFFAEVFFRVALSDS
jgi:hypothetical protein